MRIVLTTIFGLAIISVLLTRLGDMYWSPGIWPRYGVGMTINKTISALIATGPVALLLGFWALRLSPLKERGVLLLGCLCFSVIFAALQLGELRTSGVRWGGKVPPMPALAMYLPYVAALGGFLFVEISRRTRSRHRAPHSASSGGHSGGENRSRRSEG